jgi:hypothetical protein
MAKQGYHNYVELYAHAHKHYFLQVTYKEPTPPEKELLVQSQVRSRFPGMEQTLFFLIQTARSL